MKSIIVPIRPGGGVSSALPNKGVIDLLKEHLESAKRGEIDAVAIAAGLANNRIRAASHWEEHTVWRLYGALSLLNAQLHETLLKGEG